MKQDLGIAGRIAQAFIKSKLTVLFIVAALALGIFAVMIIPREEEPQILVPMLDITTACRAHLRLRSKSASPCHRATGSSNIGRRICLLDIVARAEPCDRALSGWHAPGRRTHQGL